MTLNDLERPKSTLVQKRCVFWSPLHKLLVCRVAKKSTTSWQLPRVRWSYGETYLMDFGHYQTSKESSQTSTPCSRNQLYTQTMRALHLSPKMRLNFGKPFHQGSSDCV